MRKAAQKRALSSVRRSKCISFYGCGKRVLGMPQKGGEENENL